MEVVDLISVRHPGSVRAAAGEDVNKVPRVPEIGRKWNRRSPKTPAVPRSFYTPSLRRRKATVLGNFG